MTACMTRGGEEHGGGGVPSSPGFLEIAEECLAALAAALASPRSADAASSPGAAPPPPSLAAAGQAALTGPEFWLALGVDPRRAAATGLQPQRLSPNATLIAEAAPESAGLWRVFHRRRPAAGDPEGSAAAAEFAFARTIEIGAPVAEFLDGAYRGLLRREPDWDGFTHYVQRLAAGEVTRPEVLLGMATSDEARNLGIELLVVATAAAPASPPPLPPPPPPASA